MKRRISEIARFTKQPQQVAEFYATLLDVAPPPPATESQTFDVDGVTLFVHRAEEVEPRAEWPADIDHIAIRVDDLDAECERLRAAGFDLVGPSDFPWGRSAYLFDPDGRQVEIHGDGITYQ
jgi:catechol 2,3-dioxygenase-like lactoylglutathione lyase family enzyme